VVKNIIIEGGDCAGKTTLVSELQKTLRWDTRFLGHQPGNQYTRYLREYALHERTIFERGHWSEKVYSQLWDRSQPFSANQEDLLEALVGEDSLLVWCIAPERLIKERYRVRQEAGRNQMVKEHELLRAHELFAAARSKLHERYSLILYESDTFEALDEVLDRIGALAEDEG
jgi:hypothetical protein